MADESAAVSTTSSRSPVHRFGKQGYLVLWIVALLFALGNAAVVVRRLPVQRQLADNQQAQDARQAADWLREWPPQTRVLLIPERGESAFWLTSRLTYDISPRRLALATGSVSPADLRAADVLLIYGARRPALPPDWLPWKQSARLILAVPAAHPVPQRASSPLPTRSGPSWFLLPRGLFGLGMVILLGALLMGVTLRAPLFARWWANLALAHLVGAAALAWLVTFGLLWNQTLPVWPVYLVLLLLLPTGQRAYRLLFPPTRRASAGSIRLTPWEWLLILAVALGLLTAIERGLLIGLDWDGFMIWQLKAKAFFLDGNVSLLRDPSHFPYAHLDYPLLVPMQSWWLYRHIGAVSDRWAQASGLLFYADMLILFAASARLYLSRTITLLGLAILACLPEATMHAVSGYADIPLAAYLLALGVCLMRLLTAQETNLTPLIAWLLAGTVLTKNEGLLACLAALTVAALCARRRQGSPRRLWKRLWFWSAAAAGAYLPWLWIKRSWHLVNYIFEPTQPVHFTARLFWWRLGYTLWNGIVGQLARIGPWFPAWGLVGLLFLVGLIATWRRRVVESAPLWLLAGFQWLGYVGIYLITPAALPAHIGSSAERLILHVTPLLLLASLIGCFAATPQNRVHNVPV